MIEHIAVGKVGLGNDIICKIRNVDPFCELGKQRIVGKVPVQRIFAYTEEIVFRSLKRSEIAANNIHCVRIDAVMRRKIILILIFVQVINAPVLSVNIYNGQACFHLFNVKPFYRFHKERIADACSRTILPGIAQHERSICRNIAVCKEGIICLCNPVTGAQQHSK